MKQLREIGFGCLRLYTEKHEVEREPFGNVRKRSAGLPDFGMNYKNRFSSRWFIIRLKNMDILHLSEIKVNYLFIHSPFILLTEFLNNKYNL